MSEPVPVEELDILFDALAIGNLARGSSKRQLFYHEVAMQRAWEILRWEADVADQNLFETRIRLALHLSPRVAINYDQSNPTPRWRLISAHLVKAFGRTSGRVDALAKDIARVLDSFERGRDQVTHHLKYLRKSEGDLCQNCKVVFGCEPITLLIEDEYKPYFTSPNELLEPEVDHKEAISALGTNVISNLQLLCRLCNQGKGDGLGLSVRQEAKHAGTPIQKVPVPHRCRLVFYVIQRDESACSQCDSTANELTIRPIVSSGGLVRSNLRSVCVECLL